MRTQPYLSSRVLTRAISVLFAVAVVIGFSANSAFANAKYSGIVMDAKTGRVLYSHKSGEYRYPASLTKMMTLYMVFEAMEAGKVSKKTRVRMSKYAASRPPSKLGIKPGRTLSMEQAIYALVTKSANDVATAVGEHLGGSEAKFARMMTKRARQLGMSRTTFKNANGLTAKGQLSSAKDMAILGIALREHYPHQYRYFSTRQFKFGKRKYGNHNRLLGRVKGVDGIKTGYTRASGFNLVSSVTSGKRSIVAVVMGGKSGKSRNAQMQSLISRYLKKATRRSKRNMLVAKAGRGASSFAVAQAFTLPKRGPIPVFRAQNSDPTRLRIEQAHVASVAYAPTSRQRSQSVDAIRNKLLAMHNSNAPVPTPNPTAGQDRITTASVRPANPVGLAPMNPGKKPVKVSTGLAAVALEKPTRPAGWHVQIAAVPSQKAALTLLSKARKKAPRNLAASIDYLEPVSKGGETLYRARFAGFSSKGSARAACNALKKRKINCLAIKS